MNFDALNPVMEPSRPRLLVVDDQAVNIQVIYQAFAADHQVLMATSGEQALQVCAAQQPDLVLLDVMMPGIDGYEVCQRLKADPVTRDIPVIFVTGNNDDESETHGLAVGAVDFITKPVNPLVVRARVKTHLTLKAQSDLLRSWVYMDGLTGVHNRRYLDEHLAVEARRAARGKNALSVILIDVDFFKKYNDLYGHQMGDDCLRRVAQAMRQQLKRPGDLLARYGGEEFVCLLPETDLTGAMLVAELLRQQVYSEQIPHGDSSVASMVTVSLGVACVQGSAEMDVTRLLGLSDAQLYESKSKGRNQVSGAHLR